jgi:hypothetical protein
VNLADERIEFREEGTGEMRTDTIMHGPLRLRFLWRSVGYGVIECQSLYDEPELDYNDDNEEAQGVRFDVRPTQRFGRRYARRSLGSAH